MGRPVYPHELNDPDFAWLISSYKEANPGVSVVDSTCLPVVFIEHSTKVIVEEEATAAGEPPVPIAIGEPAKQDAKPTEK